MKCDGNEITHPKPQVLRNEITALELIPSSGGAFEIIVDGVKVHSKLKTRQYPEISEAIRIIEK